MNFNAHLKLSYDISKDLSVSGFGAYSYASNENDQFCPTWVWAQGNLYRGEFKSEEWLANVQANYQHVWGIHDLKAMAGAGIRKMCARDSGLQPRALPITIWAIIT